MNEFLKKFSSISTLAGVVLAVLAFCPRGNVATTVFLAVFISIWAGIRLSLWVWATARSSMQNTEEAPQCEECSEQEQKPAKRNGTRVQRADGSDFEIPEPDHTEPDGDDPGQLLLASVTSHITDLLRASYPGATWHWQCDDPLKEIVQGGEARIRLYSVPNFTNADVCFSDPKRLEIVMIHMEYIARPQMEVRSPAPVVEAPSVIIPAPLAPVAPPVPVAPAAPVAAVAPKVQETDVNVWYSMIGRQALEQIITDLNVRGCRKLTIDESGAVYATEEGKEAKKELSLDRMPAKRYWEELKRILGEADLKATIANDQLVIGW